MSRVLVGEQELDIGLFVFDKDGLLFQSKPFWVELANTRIQILEAYVPGPLIAGWLDLMGVAYQNTSHGITAKDVDSMGIFAVASPLEEATVTAAYLTETQRLDWVTARNRGMEIFEAADRAFRLNAALRPCDGFPDIFDRLRKAGIPYGIATSDTSQRAMDSVALFDDPAALAFTVTPADVSKGKPYPDMLQLISEKTGVPLPHIAMVGDSLVDMEMAHRAGAIGIGIPEAHAMGQRMGVYTRHLLTSLREIRPL